MSDLNPFMILKDFKATQPRKKRNNINAAVHKLKNHEPLNKREKEALDAYIRFGVQYFAENPKEFVQLIGNKFMKS